MHNEDDLICNIDDLERWYSPDFILSYINSLLVLIDPSTDIVDSNSYIFIKEKNKILISKYSISQSTSYTHADKSITISDIDQVTGINRRIKQTKFVDTKSNQNYLNNLEIEMIKYFTILEYKELVLQYITNNADIDEKCTNYVSKYLSRNYLRENLYDAYLTEANIFDKYKTAICISYVFPKLIEKVNYLIINNNLIMLRHLIYFLISQNKKLQLYVVNYNLYSVNKQIATIKSSKEGKFFVEGCMKDLIDLEPYDYTCNSYHYNVMNPSEHEFQRMVKDLADESFYIYDVYNYEKYTLEIHSRKEYDNLTKIMSQIFEKKLIV